MRAGTPRPAAVLVILLIAVTLAACGKLERPSVGAPAPPPTTTTTAVPFRVVAEVHPDVKSIAVYDAPDASAPKLQLSNPTADDVVRVLLVDHGQGTDWLKVDLPVRPNGSTGFIKSSDVDLKEDYWRISVELGARRITVWNGDHVVHTEPVGVGAAASPTPPGEYFITEALTVPSFQRSAYGPYAFGTSAHSDVYTTFGAGDGTVGIHGTGDPSSLGKDVSHGCIRLSNDGITSLIHQVPLGTPVEILA